MRRVLLERAELRSRVKLGVMLGLAIGIFGGALMIATEPPPGPTPPVVTTAASDPANDGAAERTLEVTAERASSAPPLVETTLPPVKTPTARVLGASPTSDAPSGNASGPVLVHTVQPGENLTVIGERYGVTVEALVEANELETAVINPGEVLTIPQLAATPSARGRPRMLHHAAP